MTKKKTSVRTIEANLRRAREMAARTADAAAQTATSVDDLPVEEKANTKRSSAKKPAEAPTLKRSTGKDGSPKAPGLPSRKTKGTGTSGTRTKPEGGGKIAKSDRSLKRPPKGEKASKPTGAPSSKPKQKKAKKTKRKGEAKASSDISTTPLPTYPPLASAVALTSAEAVRLGNGRKVEIGGLRDEHGAKYVWCREGGRIVLTRYDSWHGGGGDASAALRTNGLVVVGSMTEIREAVEKLKRFPRLPIVSKPGWSRYGFVLADGRVLGPDGQPEPLKAFAPASGLLDQGGTLDGWRERVAAPLADHLLASFFMMMMFAAALLRLTNRADNFGFELSGEAGRGKSTLQLLMASAAGPAIGVGDATYWRSLNTTINALETVMALYDDMPLILDEAGLIQGGGKAEARALSMREMAFRLAAGLVKHRFGEPAGPRSRLVYILSTNRPISSLLGTAHAAESDAIADRLITMPLLPDRPHGIFDHCPASYESTGAFAEALKQAASEHYGHALPAFLKYLAEEMARDPKALRARIDSEVNRFVQRSGTNTNDGSQTRVAKAVGLVYAGGRLAKAAGVLPDSYRCMGAARAALDLHRMHGRVAISFDDRLLALMRHPETFDLSTHELATLTKKQRSGCPAFLYTGRSAQRELLIPIEHIDRVFPGWKGISDDADVERRLKPSSDRKTRDRPVGDKGAQRPRLCVRHHRLGGLTSEAAGLTPRRGVCLRA